MGSKEDDMTVHTKTKDGGKNMPFTNELKVCWQKNVRDQNLRADLKAMGLTELPNLKIKDLEFSMFFPGPNDETRQARDFIIKYDWLKTVTQGVSHIFKATYQGNLAGIVMIGCPTTFSKMMGDDDLERLICRGACISWSPKNLASSLVMYAVKWMVNNTKYRFFTAYADPTAGELGSIYQACNFRYLGGDYGSDELFTDPLDERKKSRNGRWFKRFSVYMKYAKYLGYEWDDSWNTKTVIHWAKMPTQVVEDLKDMAKLRQLMSIKTKIPKKNKYCLLLGKNRSETRRLNKRFEELNPNRTGFDYPKVRGVWKI